MTDLIPPDIPGFINGKHIGGGGFADVYLFHQQNPSRQVAVKVLKAEHLNAQSLQQFGDEANIMAEVSQHPYIVSVFTAGIAADGRPYLVMEFYPRPHFGVRARGGSMSVTDVLKVGVQVCSAVQTAHQSAILHRDIKPSNILTSDYGHPGLTDFGIAGVRRNGEIDSASAVTIPYSPPEILDGTDDTGSELTDVYSLGATLYALLAGRPPQWVPGGDNSQAALTSRIVNSQSLPPTGRADTGALEHVLAMSMSRDPEHRPQSAAALAELLRDVEIQRQLPPTPIEVKHVSDSVRRPGRNEPVDPGGDHDGTRLAPQVVHSQSPHPAPRQPIGEALNAITGAAVAPPTTARHSESPAISDLHHSSAPDTFTPPRIGPPPSPGRSEGADFHDPLTRRHKPVSTPHVCPEEIGEPESLTSEPSPNKSPKLAIPRPLLIAGVGVLVIVVVVTMATLSGSNASNDSADQKARNTPASVTTGKLVVPTALDSPADIAASWNAEARSLVVSWTPPDQSQKLDLSYRVIATASDGDSSSIDPTVRAAFAEQAFNVNGTEVRINLPSSTDPPCVRLQSIGPNQTGSDLSSIVCPT